MDEAIIVINGVSLNIGQSMTLRVAVTSFLTNMQNEGLGEDPAGKSMAEAYIARASEIEELLVTTAAPLKQCEASGGHNDCPNSVVPGRRYCAEHSRPRRSPWSN